MVQSECEYVQWNMQYIYVFQIQLLTYFDQHI